MGQLLHEVNDSVYFIVDEGLFILLKTDDHTGYFDEKGIVSMLAKAIKTGGDTSDLDTALSILRSYQHRLQSPELNFIPANGGLF